MAVITEIRTIRSEKNVSPGRKITAICQGTPDVLAILEENRDDLKTLAGLEQLILEEPGETPEKSVSAVVKGINLFLPLADMVDLEEEMARIKKELDLAEKELQRAESKLANEGFISKAPSEVVEKERQKAESYAATVQQLKDLLREMQD